MTELSSSARRFFSRWFTVVAIALISAASARAQLTAGFTANVTNGCAPLVVNFTDSSTGNPTNWSWDFGNGSSVSGQNSAPSTVYLLPGTYSVKLTVSDGTQSNTRTRVNYINVYPRPNISFTASDTTLSCAPKTVAFTSTVTQPGPGPLTYLWDFGNGASSTQANPTYTYTAAGNYTVTVVVTNAAGCVGSSPRVNYIKIKDKPQAQFTVVKNPACTPPATYSFSNNSTGGPLTYKWYFGDGDSSTVANPTHNYAAFGTYTVQLVVNNGACTDTAVQTVTAASDNSVPSFTESTLNPCVNAPVTFTNTSAPAPASVFWNFGDGTNSTTLNPTKTYVGAGTYTVTLTNYRNGCTTTTSKTVQVAPLPTASFTANPAYGCTQPLTVSFTNTSTGAATYLWDFGDNTTSTSASPSHTYTSNGTFQVTVTAVSAAGCSTTSAITPVRVGPATVSLGINGNTCSNVPLAFTAAVTPAIPGTSYSWNFGDGTPVVTTTTGSATHAYAAAGTYTVQVTATLPNGCTATATAPAIISTRILSNFTVTPQSACINVPLSFSANNGGATSYIWSFFDGSAPFITATQKDTTHSYASQGVYNVRLIVNNNGCLDTTLKTNHVTVTGPEAQFNNTFSCANKLAQTFNNTSLRATSYSWDFGDNTTSTQANPTHTYASYGTFNVTLTASDGTCTSTVTNVLRITNIDSTFTATPTAICRNQSVVFTLTDTTGIQSVKWQFGDGDSSSASSPLPASYNHLYTTPGNYTVSLTTTDNQGCSRTFVRNSYVNVRGIVPDFTANPRPPCVSGSTTFTDLSNAASGTITARTWYFGDGSAPLGGNNPSPTHTYTALGSYDVKLVVTDGFGCSDSITKVGFIQPVNPTADFTVSSTVRCIGEQVTFVNTSTNAVSYFWDFGDGTTSTDTNPVKSYNTPGTYSVQLIAIAAGGCRDTSTTNVDITILQNAAMFTMSDSVASCPPLAIQLTSNPSTPAGTQFNWTFGNGSGSTASNPSVVYNYPGTYTVKLVATTPSGCKDSFTRVVRVYGPTATLTYSPIIGCMPLTVTLTANAQSTNSVTYDFGDGVVDTSTAAISTKTHTYTAAGAYVPKLILGNLAGCRIAVVGTDTIKVGTLTAGFTYTPATASICAGRPIQFTDTSKGTTGPVTSWSWAFGDGTTSSAANPIKTFNTAGTYNVRLIVTAGVCRDTVFRSIVISPRPVLAITGSGPICAGASVQLQVSGATTYSWTPTSSLSCSSCPNPVASPTASTNYSVIGTDTLGCQSTAQVAITVRPRPNLIVSPDTIVCSGRPVRLTASGAINYQWSPATGLSDSTIANPIASPASTTHYQVIGTFVAGGCRDTAYVTVTVNQSPVLALNNDTSICSGNSVQFLATGADTYAWAPGTGTGLSDSTIANPTATPSATTTYTVIGTNNNGCKDTGTVTVTVRPSPVIDAGPNQDLCPGETYTIPNVGIANSYSWTPTTNLSCTNCASPTVSAAATPGAQTYTVVGTGLNGCSDSAVVTITTRPNVALVVNNDTTICNNSSITLTASGADSYQWSPAAGMSNPTAPVQTVSPAVTTTYTVIGTSIYGCSDTDSVVVTVNPAPVVTVGNNFNLCFGSSAQLNASGATSYQWSPSTGLSCTTCPNPVANPTGPITYTIVGTANGCTDTAYLSISPVPQPVVTATASKSAICYGQTVTLTASGAATYSWVPTANMTCQNCATAVALPNSTQTFQVVGASNGCTDTATVTVTVNPLPVVTVNPDTATICAGQPIRLVASGAATYSWSPATGLSTTTKDTTFAAPMVNTIYQISGVSAAGCTATAQSVLYVNPVADVQAFANDTAICEGTSTNLQASGALTYNWYPATGLSCTTCPNPVASPTISTNYRVIGTGVGLCPDTAYVSVSVTPKPELIVSPAAAAICAGSSVQLNASSPSGGVYSWSPFTGLSCTNCTSPLAQPEVSTTYTVKLTAATGCSTEEEVPVTVKELPNVSAGPDRTICAGVPTQLNATGAATYQWLPAIGLSCSNCKDPFVTLSGPATYVITGTDVYGCTNTDTLNLTPTPSSAALLTRDTAICIGSSVRLQATGGTSYSWSPASSLSNPSISNPTATPTQNTTYQVVIENAGCYTETLSVTVKVVPRPIVNAGSDVNVGTGSSVTLNGTVSPDVIQYFWTPVNFLSCNDCLNPVATPSGTITYTLHGISSYGCEETDEVTLFTKCSSSEIFMPNTFTPNGDGQNDRFYPRGTGLKTVSSFRIFSRWGEQVFEAQNINLNDEYSGWDGTFKGNPLKPDTYVWILDGICGSGDPITIKGDISIIR